MNVNLVHSILKIFSLNWCHFIKLIKVILCKLPNLYLSFIMYKMWIMPLTL